MVCANRYDFALHGQTEPKGEALTRSTKEEHKILFERRWRLSMSKSNEKEEKIAFDFPHLLLCLSTHVYAMCYDCLQHMQSDQRG